MKHTQKIVKIALLLQKKFGWDELQINCFINRVSQFTSSLRELNELVIANPNAILSLSKQRNLQTYYAKSFIIEKGIEEITFSKDPSDCPIKMNLGKEFANYADDKSFVVDL